MVQITEFYRYFSVLKIYNKHKKILLTHNRIFYEMMF